MIFFHWPWFDHANTLCPKLYQLKFPLTFDIDLSALKLKHIYCESTWPSWHWNADPPIPPPERAAFSPDWYWPNPGQRTPHGCKSHASVHNWFNSGSLPTTRTRALARDCGTPEWKAVQPRVSERCWTTWWPWNLWAGELWHRIRDWKGNLWSVGGAFSRVGSRSDAGQACLPYRGIGEWSERSKSGPLLSLRHAVLCS